MTTSKTPSDTIGKYVKVLSLAENVYNEMWEYRDACIGWSMALYQTESDRVDAEVEIQ